MIPWTREEMQDVFVEFKNYRKISNISRTKFQNLNDSRLVLQLSALSIEARC